MMVNPKKGILLANDICECITDPLNNLYNREVAVKEAFNLLTVPTKCPPDLLDKISSTIYLQNDN